MRGGQAGLPRGDIFLAETFRGLRIRGPGGVDSGSCLIARGTRGIGRFLAGGPRRDQLALPIEIALRILGDGQCLIEGLLGLDNLLWT